MTTPARTPARRFAHLCGLNILTNVTVPLVGLVDTVMLGHLPDIRFLAGVALAGVIFDFLFWTFALFRMSTTGTTAQAMGRGDQRALHLVLQRSLVLALVCAAAVVALRVPLGDFAFGLLAGETGVEAAAREYYDVRIWGAPAVLVNLVFLGWFLGREESRLALVMTAVANLANVALNYVFILRLGLAAYGAGLATLIAQYLSLGVALYFYAQRRGGGWPWREILDPAELRSFLGLQRDILIRTLCLVTAFSLFTSLSALLGTAVLTANALLQRIITLAAYLIDGAAFATETLVGHLHGARDRGALRRLLGLALLTGLGVAGVMTAAMVVLPQQILGLMTSHAEIVDLAASYRGWLGACLLLGAVAFIFDGFFLGLTAGATLRNGMLLALASFLPVAYVAIHLRSPHLLWLSFTLFMLTRAGTLVWASRRVL